MPNTLLSTADLATLVLDATAAAYAVCNPVSGEVVWANRRFCGLFPTGFDANDLLKGRRAPDGWRLETRPLDPTAEGASQSPEALTPGSLTPESLTPGRSAPERLVLVELTPVGGENPPDARRETDAVTNVLARGVIMATVEQRFAARQRRPFALVFLDLVDFKLVNDRHGHLVGDKCLAELGSRLHQLVRAADAVGRYGGDEFLILLDGVHDAATYAPIRDRVIEGIAEPIAIGDLVLRLGASLGVAYSTDGYDDVEAMLHAADSAMYAQKRGASLSGD